MALTGNQQKLDKNKDGEISGADFQMMKGGGMVKSKGMAKGGMVKSKGMAKGGKVMTKGYARGGRVKPKGMANGGLVELRRGDVRDNANRGKTY